VGVASRNALRAKPFTPWFIPFLLTYRFHAIWVEVVTKRIASVMLPLQPSQLPFYSPSHRHVRIQRTKMSAETATEGVCSFPTTTDIGGELLGLIGNGDACIPVRHSLSILSQVWGALGWREARMSQGRRVQRKGATCLHNRTAWNGLIALFVRQLVSTVLSGYLHLSVLLCQKLGANQFPRKRYPLILHASFTTEVMFNTIDALKPMSIPSPSSP